MKFHQPLVRRLFVSLTLAAGLTAPFTVPVAQAQPAAAMPALPAGMTQITSVEGITEYRLANGLQVLLAPDDSKPTTTVNVTYHVGSRHESYGETGMAHLLEHLLFKGSPTTRNPWAEFSRRGLRANGSTSFDRTNYFASFNANDDTLRWYLAWQADAMVNSFIARADLDTEMTVVRNEFENGENNPSRVLVQKVLAVMYQWHNYGKSTIGARSDIENVDIPRLQAFYRRYYQPDNATLIVSGRFDASRVLGWVAQSFGPLPKPARTLQRTYTVDPPQDGEREVTVRRVGGAPLLMMAYHLPAGTDPDFVAADLVASVLGDTPGGRLHKRVVERGLATQSGAFAWTLAEPAPMFMTLTLAPGQDIAAARAEMGKTIESLRTEPITAEEFERARTVWLNAWDQSFSDPERIGVQLSEVIGLGDWRLYFLQRDQVRKLTLADVQRVADTWLKRDNRSVGVYLPTAAPERAPQARTVDVAALLKDYKGDANTAQAEAFEATPANLDARTQISQTAAGLKVALLPKGTRGRTVQARLRLHYGTEQSLKGLEMVGAVAAALIDKGGAGLTRQQIADRFDRLQAEVGFSANNQTLQVSISTKRDQLPEVIALVGKLLRDPAYTEAALEELRRQYVTSIERQRKEPSALIANRIGRHGNPYPRGDLRYVSTFDEIEQDVKAVTVARLREFHRRFHAANVGEFTAVGDFDPAAVKQALEAAVGDWRQPAAGPQPYARMPQPLVKAPAARIVELTPDKANANLLGRLPLPVKDSDPDYAAMELANYMFGGSESSRLWRRIREREGLSYGVYSTLDWAGIDDNTTFGLQAIFAPQNLGKVETALREELARSVAEGFTQQELDEARIGLLNRRRLTRAQDAAVANGLARNLFFGRTFAFAQRADEALQSATLAQVNAAWRKFIHPQEVVTAWGGDFPAATAPPK